MPRSYKNGIPADRETAVYEARHDLCGDGDDRSCPVSEALIQAHLGGKEAVSAVHAAGRASTAAPSKSRGRATGRGGTPGGGIGAGSSGGRTRGGR